MNAIVSATLLLIANTLFNAAHTIQTCHGALTPKDLKKFAVVLRESARQLDLAADVEAKQEAVVKTARNN